MSFEISLLMRHSQLPSPAQWNEAIKAAGFDLVLDVFNWEPVGFVPARLLGYNSGFELGWCDADVNWVGSEPGPNGVVLARLGGRWFELVCAMCSLAALQSGTEFPLNDDWEQHPPQQAMAAAQRLYNQARIIIGHLGEPNATLAWNEPPLGHAETEQTRRADLEALVSDRTLIRENAPLGERFRLHKLRRQQLAAELEQMNTPGTAS